MNDQAPVENSGKKGGIGAGAIMSLIGLAVLLIFMLQNREQITLNFLMFAFTWPLWLYGLIMAVFGAMLWFGLGVLRRHRRRKERRDDRRD